MRVLVFGDSITQGFWDSEGGWVSRLRKTYDKVSIETDEYNEPYIFNLGVSGNTSDDLLTRFNDETKARANGESTFIISIGVNDSRTKAGVNFSDTKHYTQNLSKLLSLARKYSDKIIFIGLTPCVEERSNPVSWGDTGYTNGRIGEFDAALRNFCEENHVTFVEVFEPFSTAQNETELLPDGLHPNNVGQQLLADLVQPVLDDALKQA